MAVVGIIHGYIGEKMLRDWIQMTWLSWPDLSENIEAEALLRANPMMVSLYRLAQNPAQWSIAYLHERTGYASNKKRYPMPTHRILTAWDIADIENAVKNGPVCMNLTNPWLIDLIERNIGLLGTCDAKKAFSKNPAIFVDTSRMRNVLAELRW